MDANQNDILYMFTEVGILVIFEPDEIVPFMNENDDSLITDEMLLTLARTGMLAPLNVRFEGRYLCRITSDPLTADELQRTAQIVDGLWLRVRGHEIVVSGMETLHQPQHRFVDEFGSRTPFTPGDYRFTIHRLWSQSNQTDVDDDTDVDFIIRYRKLYENEPPPKPDYVPDISFL